MAASAVTVVLHDDAIVWLGQLPPASPIAAALTTALTGCSGCRAIEIRVGSIVDGFAAYVFEPSGLHWHYSYTDGQFRRRGLARRAYGAMIDDARTNWSTGQPFLVEAQGNTPEGRYLLGTPRFQQVGLVYSRQET